jgi:5-methylcytosine-specific restriction endonuclease McrA
MSQSLVLNATYDPLGVVSHRRAVVLVLSEKATTVEATDEVAHSERSDIVIPCIVRLNRFVRVPHRVHVPLTRRGVFARDGGRCVYCGAPATSLDHVVPRSRGGAHTWENVVSACRRCNHVKGDRSVSELGWRMSNRPWRPTGSAWIILGTGRSDPRWAPYLDAFGGTGAEALPA